MTLRNKRVNTAVMVCHLLLALAVLTTQLRAQQARLPFNVSKQGKPVTIIAKEQQKQGNVYTLRGDVEIETPQFLFRADEVTYNSETGQAEANGHISVTGGPHNESITATRASYNLGTQTGKFYDVVGTTGLRFSGHNVSLTTENPFVFTGKVVEKISETKYIVHDGTVTSCRYPDPNWTFEAGTVTVDLAGSAKLYGTTFKVRKVPLFYLPFVAHPAQKLGRQSGFLIPNFGASSRKGTIIGDSIYWAINRSMDATVGAEYYSSRGWAQRGEFRARPAQNSYIDVIYSGVLDRGFGPNKIDQGGQDVKLNAETDLPHNTRGVVSMEYLSKFIYRLAFTETFNQAVDSEVRSQAFVTHFWNGYFLNADAARYQNFQSTARGDVITIAHAPSFSFFSVPRQLKNTPVYWSLESAAEGITRREPAFKTNDLVGRFDLEPRAAMPLFLHGWTLRPSIGLRETYYTQRKAANTAGAPIDDPLNRKALETEVELRPPTLGRVFTHEPFGRKWKHTIEPRATYRFVTGLDSFANVIRFDAKDILSDTNEIEYALVNRLFSKRTHVPPCDATRPEVPCDDGPQDFLTWELAQKYFIDETFGGAVVNGQRNVFETTAMLTGIAFLTGPRHFSPVVSKLRARLTSNTDASWQLDYDTQKGRINASNVFVNYRLGDFFLGGSHAFLHAPGEIFVSTPIPTPEKFNQFRVLLGYGGPNHRGLSSAASIGFDAERGFLQYGSLQTTYNWDCCGVSMEYRRFALGTVRNENQFRFAFTLANIGTFGNLKRQEKLF